MKDGDDANPRENVRSRGYIDHDALLSNIKPDTNSLCKHFFFFSSRRRHTRCSRDWSSDVCSSDLVCYETYAAQVLKMRPDDKVFSAAKLFFAYGLGNAGYFPMGAGAQSVLYPHRPTADAVFEIIARHRPTLFFGVPTLYAAMLALKEPEKRWDVSSLRLCVSAGEALPEELYNRWRERFGVELIDGVGPNEILHNSLSNRPGRSRPGSTGLPVPGYEATVVR